MYMGADQAAFPSLGPRPTLPGLLALCVCKRLVSQVSVRGLDTKEHQPARNHLIESCLHAVSLNFYLVIKLQMNYSVWHTGIERVVNPVSNQSCLAPQCRTSCAECSRRMISLLQWILKQLVVNKIIVYTVSLRKNEFKEMNQSRWKNLQHAFGMC